MTTTSCTCFLPIKEVLCATDFSAESHTASQAAIQLCLAFGATLTFLTVVEYGDLPTSEDGGRLLASDPLFKDAESSLHVLEQEAKSRGVVSKRLVMSGIAHDRILEMQQAAHIDLIVLGTRSVHGFKRLVFGSTAEAVLRSVPCPVLTVGPLAIDEPPAALSKYGIVLFATDFDTTTTDALRFAAFLAEKLHLQLHCLHVLPRGVQDTIHEGIIPLIIKEGLQHLVTDLKAGCGDAVCAVSYGSEVSNAVVAYARLHATKLIVLGVRRASLTASHIPAHIVYRIITEAPCPVITIAFTTNGFLAAS